MILAVHCYLRVTVSSLEVQYFVQKIKAILTVQQCDRKVIAKGKPPLAYLWQSPVTYPWPAIQ